MSLLRTSRLAEHLTKTAILSAIGKGLWGATKGVGAVAGKLGFGKTVGLAGGAATLGMGANEAAKSSKEDMSSEGFAQRMGYGG
jgi:hypothetical protein